MQNIVGKALSQKKDASFDLLRGITVLRAVAWMKRLFVAAKFSSLV